MNARSLALFVAVTASMVGCQEFVSFDPAHETGAQCTDGVDNDGNGLIDCADPSCAGAANCMQCGDGNVEAGEQCDDGPNNSDFGACLPNCMMASCGDGFSETGVEQCDDGADNSNIGACLLDCKLARCGDNFIEINVEECDDGAGNDNSGHCLLDCRVAFCGDGFVEAGVEECDLGVANGMPGGSCTAACQIQQANLCGDGQMEAGEQCDQGALNSNQGMCLLDCQFATCGDGFIESNSPEQCDDGASNGVGTDACSMECKIQFCGDGIPQANLGEACDDGAGNSDSGDCLLSCQNASCGDGFIDTSNTNNQAEQCDDGAANGMPGDPCDATCHLVGGG